MKLNRSALIVGILASLLRLGDWPAAADALAIAYVAALTQTLGALRMMTRLSHGDVLTVSSGPTAPD